jgi:UDP-N-acetylmuramoylalanine--D-glutamate ligase
MYITKNSFLVVGVSRSGVAAADFILALGGICYLCDEQKTDGILMSVGKLTEKGAIWVEMNEVEAMLSKIDVVVLSPGVPIDNSIPVTAKRMGKRIIGEMELGYMFSVNPIIAVTGTNGKTTTCSMIAAMLDKAGVKNELLGNIGVPYTSKISNMDYNTVAVTEVSSFQLETLSSFTPHIAVITNITEDHLSRHYNMQNYVYLKNKLIVNQRESEYSVLNYDDYIVRSFADKAKSKVVFFSTKQKVDGVYIDDDLMFV